MTSDVGSAAGMASQSRRIAVLQFTPHHGNSALSRQKAEALCAKLEPGTIDLLVAPEMCLSGYIFQKPEEVRALAESSQAAGNDDGSGAVTIAMAQSLSKRLGCYTLAGFPEVESHAKAAGEGATSDPLQIFDARPSGSQAHIPENNSGEPRMYNSAVLTSPSGSIVRIFRKHFLFDADELWAHDGSGFQYVDLPRLGRLGVGICMDLNPWRFKVPFDRYELASYCVDKEIDILAVPMAWLRGADGDNEEPAPPMSDPQIHVINYWATRCAPLWRQRPDGSSKRTLFITANRTGTEAGR